MALTKSNIKSRFCVTRIWPYNWMVIVKKMGSSKFYNSFRALLADHGIAMDLNNDNTIEYAMIEVVAIAAY